MDSGSAHALLGSIYSFGSSDLKMNNCTLRLSDLPVKCLVRVGCEGMGQRSWTRGFLYTTRGFRSDVFSPSDPLDDPGPSASLERLVPLNAPFLSVFLGYQTCLLCNILQAHDFFLFCFFSKQPSFSQKCSQTSLCFSYHKAEHISWWLNKLHSTQIN